MSPFLFFLSDYQTGNLIGQHAVISDGLRYGFTHHFLAIKVGTHLFPSFVVHASYPHPYRPFCP